ncbi:patatin-like phospholipase family protein [Actibacterium lipolyticum]|uniref:PNPLA domain-containing protein n=1 Tax=Actibacterium lipolyticum TaxID=1524263 RepID=A0A238JZC4_9RHOB|nr:patatin-like phospholipase family protein [Actibacterium lipolyticum]SMX35056.1 hypothetical protein COL8621_01627 [Actibacterium lipolyticum]
MAVKRINLALQGGGAHGAFTWGVLDRILEDEGIEIAAISGTSAGALNGAALKAGLLSGGREGARENLAWLWGQIGAVGDMRMNSWMAGFAPGTAALSRTIELSLSNSLVDTASRMMSPYFYGPFYQNPLQRVVDQFDFGRVCTAEGPRFYVCATNVRTGKARIFTKDEISTDAILASACLPTVFKAIEIDDPTTGKTEAYWDGGYTGNPALFPLYDLKLPDDIVVVNINPLVRDSVPVTPQDIQNRINEVSFNSSLLRELRSIAFVKRLIAEGRIEEGTMKNVLIHMVSDDTLMQKLNVVTKLVPNPLLLDDLFQAGRAAADGFLETHRGAINNDSTVDLAAMFN